MWQLIGVLDDGERQVLYENEVEHEVLKYYADSEFHRRFKCVAVSKCGSEDDEVVLYKRAPKYGNYSIDAITSIENVLTYMYHGKVIQAYQMLRAMYTEASEEFREMNDGV